LESGDLRPDVEGAGAATAGPCQSGRALHAGSLARHLPTHTQAACAGRPKGLSPRTVATRRGKSLSLGRRAADENHPWLGGFLQSRLDRVGSGLHREEEVSWGGINSRFPGLGSVFRLPSGLHAGDWQKRPPLRGRKTPGREGNEQLHRQGTTLLPPGLLEAGDGFDLVVVYVEHCIKLGNLQEVVNFLGEIQQL
jgi:hypothetical protein